MSLAIIAATVCVKTAAGRLWYSTAYPSSGNPAPLKTYYPPFRSLDVPPINFLFLLSSDPTPVPYLDVRCRICHLHWPSLDYFVLRPSSPTGCQYPHVICPAVVH
ncbi:hypothetical protein BKA83DRAFT_2267519 [Pisolithus microcarpus]|nr:hypothetical protein BKA83DRAFT_2267519 [Pisolithus microcarpus]